MGNALALLTRIDWGTVLAVVSLVALLVSAISQVIDALRKLTPAQRRDWLHAALQVAVQLQQQQPGIAPIDVSATMARDMNAFLKLHNLPLRVEPAQVQLLLADAKVLLTKTAAGG